jgi:hypothetical protein
MAGRAGLIAAGTRLGYGLKTKRAALVARLSVMFIKS